MYCSKCTSYIPTGINLPTCPSCNVDIINEAIPTEKLIIPETEVVPEPIPLPEPKKNTFLFWARSISVDRSVKEMPATKSIPVSSAPVTAVLNPDERSSVKLFQAVFLSFCSPSLYRDVARKWRGAGMFYMSVSSTIIAIPFTMYVMILLGQQNFEAFSYREQIPAFQIKDASLRMLEKAPVNIINRKEGKIVVTFDLSGNMYPPKETLLMGQQSVFFQDQAGTFKSIPYPKELNFSVNWEILDFIIDSGIKITPFFLYPFIACIESMVLIISAFFLSLIGLIISALARAKLGFAALYRISAVAVTPAIILNGIWLTTVSQKEPSSFILMGINFFYLLFAIISIKLLEKLENKNPASPTQVSGKGKATHVVS